MCLLLWDDGRRPRILLVANLVTVYNNKKSANWISTGCFFTWDSWLHRSPYKKWIHLPLSHLRPTDPRSPHPSSFRQGSDQENEPDTELFFIIFTSNSIWASDLGIVPVPFLSKHLHKKMIFEMQKNWKLTWRRLQFERRNFSPSQFCSSCPADQEASESRTHLGRFEWSGPEWEDLNLQLNEGENIPYQFSWVE